MDLIERLGGVADPAAPPSPSQVAQLLRRELARGLAQIGGARAGYDRPLVAAAAGLPGRLLVVVPVDARVRSDAAALDGRPRAVLLVAAAMEALALVAELAPVSAPRPPVLTYGAVDDALLIEAPWARSDGPGVADAEIVALQLDERLAAADRLRGVGVALPAAAAELLLAGALTERPIGHRHLLDELEVLTRAGTPPEGTGGWCAASGGSPGHHAHAGHHAHGHPLAPLLDAALGPVVAHARPHADPDPARRIARRMLQMLAGKRKWSGGTGGGFHTEVTHLTRGFEQADRELAGAVVDALLESGLLVEKVSVGQRHVSLLSRRAADITALIENGVVPPDLHLPRS